jgi:V8-like Glu-specific endopeptidase
VSARWRFGDPTAEVTNVTSKRATAALVVAMAIAYACSQHADTIDVRARDEAVTKGAIDGADPAVVGLVDTHGVGCSGTLIAPHVVLTAAHCVQGATPHGAIHVLFGSDATGTQLDIADVHVHPQFDPATFTDDLALLAIANDAPASTTPIAPLPPTPDASLAGASVTLVGFGETAADAGDMGTKRKGTATIGTVAASTFTLVAAPSHPCAGDSGGPALSTVAGTTYVAGVTSHGDSACVADDTDTRVDAFSDFITSYLATAAAGAAKVGDRCFYPSHCASGSCITAKDDATITYCAPTCKSPSDCPSTMECDDGQCRFPLPTPGAIGSTCTAQSDCATTDCNAKHVCSTRCVSGSSDCPSGFDCENVGGIDFYCMPQPKSDGGGSSGCAVPSERDDGIATPLFVTLATIGLAIARVRRRR